MRTAHFPIGLEFSKKRFPKAKELTRYWITDILETRSRVLDNQIVKIEYVITHKFMGQNISEYVPEPTIAKALHPEVLKQYYNL